jgi:hypothetical protein
VAFRQQLGLAPQSQTMHRALKAYNGQGKRALAPRMGDVDDNVQLGLARLVVDAGVNAPLRPGRAGSSGVWAGRAGAQRERQQAPPSQRLTLSGLLRRRSITR